MANKTRLDSRYVLAEEKNVGMYTRRQRIERAGLIDIISTLAAISRRL